MPTCRCSIWRWLITLSECLIAPLNSCHLECLPATCELLHGRRSIEADKLISGAWMPVISWERWCRNKPGEWIGLFFLCTEFSQGCSLHQLTSIFGCFHYLSCSLSSFKSFYIKCKLWINDKHSDSFPCYSFFYFFVCHLRAADDQINTDLCEQTSCLWYCG